MNISLIMTAVQYGATVANYTEVIELQKKTGSGLDASKVSGVRVKDRLTGEEFNIRAKVLSFFLLLSIVSFAANAGRIHTFRVL